MLVIGAHTSHTEAWDFIYGGNDQYGTRHELKLPMFIVNTLVMQLQIEKVCYRRVVSRVSFGAHASLHRVSAPQRWVDFLPGYGRTETTGVIYTYALLIAVVLRRGRTAWPTGDQQALFLTFAGWTMLVKMCAFMPPAAFNRVSKGASAKGIAAAGIVAIIFSATAVGHLPLFSDAHAADSE